MSTGERLHLTDNDRASFCGKPYGANQKPHPFDVYTRADLERLAAEGLLCACCWDALKVPENS